jgi:hypothetical protein
MIRKPPPSQMRESRTVETVRDVAETSSRVIDGGMRLGRKTGAFASAGCLGWLAFGATIGVLSTLASNAEHLFSLRGIFATIVMLAIPGTLIALTVWQVMRARSI